MISHRGFDCNDLMVFVPGAPGDLGHMHIKAEDTQGPSPTQSEG